MLSNDHHLHVIVKSLSDEELKEACKTYMSKKNCCILRNIRDEWKKKYTGCLFPEATLQNELYKEAMTRWIKDT